ncbi:hypothetical protein QYM36_010580 [Artemia franciscana]|uniref:Uncharacterized protein n=1 Tax=Artemia franciscana TaxID=6661 RepID=A0AA88HQG5_ARTSF|nr:hypothetical protein QYM36_010580 [Artemia franciscana]
MYDKIKNILLCGIAGNSRDDIFTGNEKIRFRKLLSAMSIEEKIQPSVIVEILKKGIELIEDDQGDFELNQKNMPRVFEGFMGRLALNPDSPSEKPLFEAFEKFVKRKIPLVIHVRSILTSSTPVQNIIASLALKVNYPESLYFVKGSKPLRNVIDYHISYKAENLYGKYVDKLIRDAILTMPDAINLRDGSETKSYPVEIDDQPPCDCSPVCREPPRTCECIPTCQDWLNCYRYAVQDCLCLPACDCDGRMLFNCVCPCVVTWALCMQCICSICTFCSNLPQPYVDTDRYRPLTIEEYQKIQRGIPTNRKADDYV